MHGTVVGVLRGGPSRGHDASLKSGHSILASLPAERFTVRDIYIDHSGAWHDRGKPTTPGRVLPFVDVAVICVHAPYKEIGELQKILEQFGVPYTGADSFHCFHAMHRVLAKERARDVGIQTPRYRFAERKDGAEALAREAVRTFRQPVVIKVVDSGLSEDVVLATGYKPIVDAVTAFFDNGARGVLIEELVRGARATVGIIEGLRGESLYALPPVETAYLNENQMGDPQEVYPGRFPRKVADELMEAARTMHQALGQRHYSHSEFIVTGKGIYFLKLSSAAGVAMTRESLMSKSLESVGIKMPEFASHVVELAIRK